MKKIQKISAFFMTVCLCLGLTACGGSKSEETTEKATEVATSTDVPIDQLYEGVVIDDSDMPIELPELGGQPVYIYSYDDTFGIRFDSEFRSRYPEYSDLIHYTDLSVANPDEDYLDALKSTVSTNEAPSLFIVDDSRVEEFLEWDYAASVDTVLPSEYYTANAYPYTVEYGTDANGELKAVTWECTPGVMYYNSKIADAVLGTSDPGKVQEMLSTPEKFMEVAAKMKEEGYYMMSTTEDLMRPFLDSKQTPWVTDGALTVDSAVTDYLEFSKGFYKNNYTLNQPRGTSQWSANMQNGRVFCYFGSSVWLSKGSVFVPNDQKYKACQGPFVYHLGGAYIFVGKNCPNKELVALILYTMTCDEDAMYDLGETDSVFPNNQAAVKRLIDDQIVMGDVLYGKTPLEIFDNVAKTLDRSNATKYDSQIDGILNAVALTYNTGNKSSVDEAIESLKARVSDSIEDFKTEE